MKIFKPNLTSALLIEGAMTCIGNPCRILDLGSGGGNVGLEIAKRVGLKKIYSSDLDESTMLAVMELATTYEVEVDHRIGSLFSPWGDEVFDVIIDDVSGVAKGIATVSPWFDGVPCESGDSGALLVSEVLAKSARYLAANGRIVFPIISLSDRQEILRVANLHYAKVQRVIKQEWPLPKSMLQHLDLLKQHKALGYCDFSVNFGMLICYTEIYVAETPIDR